MLQSIRDRAHGWIAAVVFGILCIAFGLWGINFYVRSGGTVVVAKVNGEEIKMEDFDRFFHIFRLQLQAMGQQNLNDQDQGMLKQQALEEMVNEKLIHQVADSANLRVGDGQVAGVIQNAKQFQQDGRFSSELYQQQLRNMGLSERAYEERVRQNMIMQQLQQGIMDTDFATPAAVDRIDRLKTQTRDLAYTIVEAGPFKADIKPTDAEIEAYYNAHSKRYMAPERVKVAYVDLSAEGLAKDVKVTEDALRAYYEEHKKSDYTTPEERSVNHILVHVDKNAKPAEVEAARKTAEKYLKEAEGGESFEELAKEHSDDAGSRAEGGKTGFFARGVMEPAFEDAAFSMKPGEIRGPIRTKYGFHIIRLNEIKPKVVRSFENAHADVEQAYRLAQAEKLYYDKADQLSNLTYENSDSLEPAAKALGLTVEQTDFFSRKGDGGLAANPKIVEAAFGSDVLEDGLNSQPIELSPTHAVVLRLLEHQAAALKPLASIRQQVTDDFVADSAKHKAADRAKAILARLEKGETRDALAASENVKWTARKGVSRSDPDVNRAVVREAFKLRPAKPGETAYGGVPLGTGDYGLVGVYGVHDGDPSKMSDDDRQQIRQGEEQSQAVADWKDFMALIRARGKVEMDTDKL